MTQLTPNERNLIQLLAEAYLTPPETSPASLQADDSLRRQIKTAHTAWMVELDMQEAHEP
jgi:hypothetical protein